jgi:pSer/pThr/pTyr-binding forkhead associated (FHA) protein
VGAAVRWELIVTVDPKLHGRVNPDAPTGEPERRFTLFDTESVIGRLDSGVRVQVPVRNDPGVSRRQAVLIRRADGTVSARDLGSANGMTVNGVELASGAERALNDGDVIGVGGWTRIVLRACR